MQAIYTLDWPSGLGRRPCFVARPGESLQDPRAWRAGTLTSGLAAAACLRSAELGGQQFALPGVVEGACDVRGGDGAKFGAGESDRLGDFDALDEIDRPGVIVGVQPRAGWPAAETTWWS